jgi:Protein of unknown function (DUF1579)
MLGDPHEVLDRLIGRWDLSGQMGETPLRRVVEAKGTLGDLFVEVHRRSVLEAPAGQLPYEALYYIGYDSESERYVMHLLDTYGPRFSRTLGIGERQGNRISFVFEYDGGPFTNTFTWHADSEEWTFDLIFLEDGAVHTFATKCMSRV